METTDIIGNRCKQLVNFTIFIFVLAYMLFNEKIIVNAQEVGEGDFQLLCILTYAEAAGEPEDGQVSVAATVLNRVEDSSFPENISNVIFQDGAFACTHNGNIYLGNKALTYGDIPEETVQAVQRALNGEDPTVELLANEASQFGYDVDYYSAGGALYFYNPAHCSGRALAQRENIQVQSSIGNHIFYKVWDN